MTPPAPATPIGRALGSPWRIRAAASALLMAGAQIAVPLTDDDRALSTVVVVAFALTTANLVADRWGLRRSLTSLAVVAIGTLALERVGSTTGFPFGEYEYTGLLEPHVGGVPLIVPLAWFAMGVPALSVSRSILGGAGSRGAQLVLGSIALTAWDLFLDPQMVGEGYWVWAVDGAYRGIPISNYVGWLGSGIVVLAVLDRLLPAAEARSGPADVGLRALYAWWAVMNTIGFVVFFGDAVVGVVGGVVMIPLALAGMQREVHRARSR